MASRAISEPIDKLIGPGFELRLSARELLVEGTLAPLERKPFDALVYLIENRDKVVSRDELLEQVWGTRYRSESVVARAIAKLRQALGDMSDEPRLIKTIHRVGYRFIGTVGGPDRALAPVGPTKPTVVPEKGRIAFLPVKVPAGEPELAWVEYGLAAIVAHGLTMAPGLYPVPMGDTIVALGSTEAALAEEEKAELLCSRLGAETVIGISIRRSGGQFLMGWELFGQRHYVGDDIAGGELTRMATILGERAAAYLQPTFLGRAEATGTGDPFVDEAFARASGALALERLDDAWKLLKICSVNGSPPLHVQTAQVHLMAMRGDPAILQEGPTLLDRLSGRSDTGAQVTILVALARYCAVKGLLDDAQRYVQDAMQLAQDVDEPLMRSSVLMSASIVARHRNDPERGRVLCDELKALAPRLPLVKQMRNLMASANNYADSAQLEKAIVEAGHALALARELGIQYNLMVALLNLALYQASDGIPAQARVYAEEALREPYLLGSALRLGFSVLWLFIYTSVGAEEVHEAQRILGRATAQLAASEARATWEDFLVFFRSLATWRLGDHEQAFAQLQAAQLASLTGKTPDPLALVPLYWGVIAGSVGRWDLVRSVAEDLLADADWGRASRTTDVEAIPELLRAMADHGRGDLARTRARLQQIIHITPGILRGQALLCAVWLTLEAGELVEARALAAQAGNWLTGTPHGQLVHARLEMADGAREAAARTIETAMSRLAPAGPVHDYARSLIASARSPDLEPPVLPNLTWLL